MPSERQVAPTVNCYLCGGQISGGDGNCEDCLQYACRSCDEILWESGVCGRCFGAQPVSVGLGGIAKIYKADGYFFCDGDDVKYGSGSNPDPCMRPVWDRDSKKGDKFYGDQCCKCGGVFHANHPLCTNAFQSLGADVVCSRCQQCRSCGQTESDPEGVCGYCRRCALCCECPEMKEAGGWDDPYMFESREHQEGDIVDDYGRQARVTAEPCPLCSGTGEYTGPSDRVGQCWECQGLGKKLIPVTVIPTIMGDEIEDWTQCPKCGGYWSREHEDRNWPGHQKCPECLYESVNEAKKIPGEREMVDGREFTRMLGSGRRYEIGPDCPNCNGTGNVPFGPPLTGHNDCYQCFGLGRQTRQVDDEGRPLCDSCDEPLYTTGLGGISYNMYPEKCPKCGRKPDRAWLSESLDALAHQGKGQSLHALHTLLPATLSESPLLKRFRVTCPHCRLTFMTSASRFSYRDASIRCQGCRQVIRPPGPMRKEILSLYARVRDEGPLTERRLLESPNPDDYGYYYEPPPHRLAWSSDTCYVCGGSTPFAHMYKCKRCDHQAHEDCDEVLATFEICGKCANLQPRPNIMADGGYGEDEVDRLTRCGKCHEPSDKTDTSPVTGGFYCDHCGWWFHHLCERAQYNDPDGANVPLCNDCWERYYQ